MTPTPRRYTALPSIFLLLCIAVSWPGPAIAQALSYDQLCDDAARVATEEAGLPPHILRAITRTETARNGVPWPWAVNMAGTGHWFESRSEAVAFAERRYAAGARNFDIGCFQINYRWHGAEFPSIAAMFDPYDNARYAARFLSALYAETGDWTAAVGAYHSRTPRHADRYLAVYQGHLATLGPAPSVGVDFPLLRTGATAMPGSLVPAVEGAVRPLFGPRP